MTENNDSYSFLEDIPADFVQLDAHIKNLIKYPDPNDPSLEIVEEFQFIENQTINASLDPNNFATALLPVNRTKNRYANVLPNEKTRVRLNEIQNEEGSDYINANFISGLVPGSEKRYVATQGPLEGTACDFWRMVWELQAVVIVMLTKEVEIGRVKCDKYWADSEHFLCNSFHVFLVDTGGTELTERKLKVINIDSAESRIVYQFQYTAWPDHGLPESTHAFLDLAHKVEQVNEAGAPIIVHCSAGIGRSGTFCTVHSIIEKLRFDMKNQPEKLPYINVVKTVLHMREQRPGMVQTQEQYVFCYLTLLEEIKRLSNKDVEKEVTQVVKEEEVNMVQSSDKEI